MKKKSGGRSQKRKRQAPAAQILFRPGAGATNRPPWGKIGWLLLLAWMARAAVALTGDFILHPDEIYQYLEPAHGIVFGNAIYTWEITFGARPFLIPWFIAGILYVMNFLGLGAPDYYIPAVKLVLCAISLALPVSMYVIARNLWSERAGIIALLLGCFWYEFVGFAHKPLSDMLSGYTAMACIAFACTRTPTRASMICAGLAAALTIGLRWQIGIMLVPFSLMLLASLDSRSRAQYVGAGLAGMAVVALLDHLAWGGFFHSTYLNIVSNLEANKLLDRDNQASAFHYILWTAWASVGLFWVVIAFAARSWRRYALFLVLLAIFMATHSLLVHREYRFAFPWIPLWLLIAADLTDRLAAYASSRKLPERAALGLVGALAGLMSAFGIANALPYQGELYRGYSKEEINISFLEPDPHLSLYRRLSKDESVEGLIELSRPLPSTGGFYYLHRKIAILPVHVLDEIVRKTGKRLTMTDWATHVVHESLVLGVPGYDRAEQGPGYNLFKVKPENYTRVYELQDYIYAPDMLIMMTYLPFLRKYLPKDRSYLFNFKDP